MVDTSTIRVTPEITQAPSTTPGPSYKPYILVMYGIEHLVVKDKVRFYYGLKGRDGQSGIVKQYKSKHLARGALLVPLEYQSEVESFLKGWKCSYRMKEAWMKHE